MAEQEMQSETPAKLTWKDFKQAVDPRTLWRTEGISADAKFLNATIYAAPLGLPGKVLLDKKLVDRTGTDLHGNLRRAFGLEAKKREMKGSTALTSAAGSIPMVSKVLDPLAMAIASAGDGDIDGAGRHVQGVVAGAKGAAVAAEELAATAGKGSLKEKGARLAMKHARDFARAKAGKASGPRTAAKPKAQRASRDTHMGAPS